MKLADLLAARRMARTAARPASDAAKRDPHFPRRGLTARSMVLSEETRLRGGKKTRRRVARVWEPLP